GIDGRARLTDFGVARGAVEATLTPTSIGALKGKPGYMAPEYIGSGMLDARSDVFALGIVAWEMLTQERLFEGPSDVESLIRAMQGKIRPPSTVRGSLPELDAVVMRALDRDPDARFQSAFEMAEALESAARRADAITDW